MTLKASQTWITVLLVCAPAMGQIIDHDDVDAVSSLPQTTMDAVGQQRWFFSHASVGGNMMSGLADLHTADPNRYQWLRSTVSYNSGELRAYNPPSPTNPGTVYDCNRGNPGWQSKFTIFDNSVRTSGWRTPAVDVSMDKLCYIDQNADPNVCISTMTALESTYPATIFVYATMPLTTSQDSSNILRSQYNDAVRAHCIANDRLLFDIADMEAHDPNGTEYTFESGGQTYQKLYSAYTDDGGHLNTVGRQRIAQGWYAVGAAIVAAQQSCTLTLNVINGAWGSITLDPEPNDANAPAYPLNETVTLTAEPIPDRYFRHWEIYDPNHPADANYALIDTNLSTSIEMMTDREITAVFKCGSGVLPLLPAAMLLACITAVARKKDPLGMK
ncbi:MAG: hypothetical protein JXQ73_13220 [Phycisphaerae bacterium]|nr:hypothetical protein [Phycisphaerae bacterium]